MEPADLCTGETAGSELRWDLGGGRQSLIHSLIPSSRRLLIHSRTSAFLSSFSGSRLLVRSFLQSLIRSFVHSFILSFIHLLIRSFTHHVCRQGPPRVLVKTTCQEKAGPKPLRPRHQPTHVGTKKAHPGQKRPAHPGRIVTGKGRQARGARGPPPAPHPTPPQPHDFPTGPLCAQHSSPITTGRRCRGGGERAIPTRSRGGGHPLSPKAGKL